MQKQLERTAEKLPQALLPAQNLEAEMSALGAMMLSERACEEVFIILKPEDFYHPAHRDIFKALQNLAHTNTAVDLVTLKNELVQKGLLSQVGGIDYLIQVAESVPSAANAVHYANIVLDKATERRLVGAADEIVRIAREPELEVQEKVDQSENAVFEVGRQRMGKNFASIKSLAGTFFNEVDQLYENNQPILGIPTGYYDLDYMTGGLYPGDLTIVAARPSMGKTSLVLNFALNVAQLQKGSVAVFSLEMSGQQLTRRMVSMFSGVSMSTLKRANLSRGDYDKLADACEHLYSTSVFIDDTSDISPIEMRGKCRRLKHEEGLAMVIVDYLQLMRSSRRPENRTQEISEIARSLKALAKEFEVPVLALSQLNRGVEARDDKRPMLSDIRESGSIEAEADLVMFIYRDSYYKSKETQSDEPWDPNKVEEAELIIAKHRNGPTGKVLVGFQPSCARFLNYKREG